MGVSIVIATHNRAGELALTLASLAEVEFDGLDFEVLVIDNASEDSTADVVARAMSRFGGRLRCIHEPRLGLSNARNRGIAEASHEIIAFLDDDVDLDPAWAQCVAAAFRDGGFAVVGGKAYLVFPGPRPTWLDDQTEGLLTKVDLGLARREAGPDELYGLNLSIRKEWLLRVGRFRTDLGRMGTCLLSSEEEELMGRIVHAGGVLLYEPAAVVGHRVPWGRLRRRWFWSRSFWGQVGVARLIPEERASAYEWLRSTWHLVLAVWCLLVASLRSGFDSKVIFQQSCRVTGKLGFWVGFTRRLASAATARAMGRSREALNTNTPASKSCGR